jgi:hypothetical protein
MPHKRWVNTRWQARTTDSKVMECVSAAPFGDGGVMSFPSTGAWRSECRNSCRSQDGQSLLFNRRHR